MENCKKGAQSTVLSTCPYRYSAYGRYRPGYSQDVLVGLKAPSSGGLARGVLVVSSTCAKLPLGVQASMSPLGGDTKRKLGIILDGSLQRMLASEVRVSTAESVDHDESPTRGTYEALFLSSE